MPQHGPPGDPHKTGGGLFGGFLEQLIPAMASGIRQWNIGTEPIRDYFDPVTGLGDPARRKEIASALTGGQTTRQVLLGELGDLKFQQGIDQTLDTAGGIASFVGNLEPDILGYLFQKPYPTGPEWRRRREQRQKQPALPNYNPGNL